jgi:hypothetical protein
MASVRAGSGTNSSSDKSILIFTSDALPSVDQADVSLAHHYRVSLLPKPRQSSFRVLALLFYEIPSSGNDDESTRVPGMPTFAPWLAHRSQDGKRTFVVGTNDEGGFIGGAICAERAAMVQFRFLPQFSITKVVISTDSVDPITPGLLCREFLAGHPTVPWDTPIISAGCEYMDCVAKDEDERLDDKSPASRVGEGCEGSIPVLPVLSTTLQDLYPFPSPYTRLTASQSVRLGEKYSSRATDDFESLIEVDSKRLLELAILEARSNISDLHPIQFGAAAIFDDGTIVTTRQASALEYGCTLDAVSQLAPHFQDQNGTPLLLVQADQYGIAHAPFAPARAFLIEHGFENCQIVVHDAPVSDNDDDIFDFDKWTLKEVFASDLAPNAPTWTKGTKREEVY